jgi:hypothetical protein
MSCSKCEDIKTATGEYPCPKCEYCNKDKTWETTRYIKGYTFLNKDACIECFNKSDNGYEKGYFDGKK